MPAPSGQLPPPWAWWENEAPTTRDAGGPYQASSLVGLSGEPALGAPGVVLGFLQDMRDERIAKLVALTKLNWNHSRLDGREPITTLAARSIGTILRHVPRCPRGNRYPFYM